MANKYSVDDIKKMIGGDSYSPQAKTNYRSERRTSNQVNSEPVKKSYTADDVKEMLGNKAQDSVDNNTVSVKSSDPNRNAGILGSGLNTEEIIPYLEESTAKDKNTVIKPNSGMIYGGSSFESSRNDAGVNLGANNPLVASYNGKGKGLSIGTIDDAIEMRENPVDIDIDKFLSDGYKMTEAERKAAAKYASDYLKEYDKQYQQGFHASKQKISDSMDEDSEYSKMVRLKNKSSTGGRFVSGLLSSIPFLDTAYDKLMGLVGSDDNFMERTFEDAETQGGAANILGKFAGNAALYSAGQSVMDSIPALSTVKSKAASGIGKTLGGTNAANNVGNFVSNVSSGLPLDITFDTIPSAVKDYKSGENSETIAKNAVKNVGLNTLFNAGGEAVQTILPKFFSRISDNNFDDVVENSGKNKILKMENSDDTLEPVVKQDITGVHKAETQLEKNDSFIKNIDPADQALMKNDLKSTHTEEEINNLHNYVNSTNDDLLYYIKLARGEEKIGPFALKDVDARMADDIKRITGIDASGNKILLDQDAIKGHIDPKHGINGKSDHSMADDNSLARIQYVLDNYDEAFKGKGSSKTRLKDQSKSPTVVFTKKIDGHYYVVEAVTDAKSKQNKIVSAFIGNEESIENNIKKGSIMRVSNATENQSLPRTSEPQPAFNTSNNILPTNSENVKIPSLEENGNFVDNIAEISQKTKSIPKSDIPKTYKLAKLDSDVTNLVKWYGDDSDIDRLVEFRKALSDFENTGAIESLHQIDEIASQLETSMKGKTYTYKDRLNKNGSVKRKGAKYTYGDTGGIDAALEDSLSSIDEIYTLKSTSSVNSQNTEIPSLKSPDEMTSNEFFDSFLSGEKTEPSTEIPRLKEPEMSSGEYVTKTATNTLDNSELFRNNPEMKKILQEEIDSGRMTFKTVTEDESIKAAHDAFKKDPVAEAERLMSSDSWKEAKDFDGGMMLLKSASDSGDYDTVRHMARKVASEGHDAGVRLQALDKYSRTAEGTIAKAHRVLDKQIKEWASNSVNDAAEAKRVSDLLKSEIQSIAESASYQDIESAVKSIIGESKISKQITDQDISEISRMLKKGYASDIENTIDTILATQQYGISDETIEAVQNIFEQANKFGENSKKRVLLENKAYALLANEVTNSSWQDKWDTWRYLSMLSKPATHERNIIGNVGMNVVSGVKNNIAAALESTVDAVSPNGIQRTKSILNPLSGSDRSLISSAAKDADEVAYRALSGSKYGAKAGIEGQAKAFRSGPGKLIQKIADKNSSLLEVEDYAGLKAKYSTSLAGYLKSNKVDATIFDATDDASKAFLDKAREYAISEAKKATFHEDSAFADALSNFSQNMRNSDNVRDKAIGAMIEGVVPFKKTPINIVKTAGRYSPLSIADAVFNKLPKALKSSGKNAGKYTVSQAIDSLASGLTGTGIMMLGAYIGSKGLIRGKGTGDEAQDSFDQLKGQQSYSIQFGDGSYTIDWMAPSVLPLLVGVELQKAWEDKGNIDSSELFNSIASLADPIVETTMMSGVSNALSNVRYSDSDTGVLSSFATGLATGYATQGVPSTLGAVARAVDNTRRDSSGTQKGVLGQLEYTLNSTKNKIPVLSEQSPEYRDAWGRTQENFSGGDGSIASNLAYQLFSPGYYSEDKTTSNDTYLQGLYDRTGVSDVLPEKVRRSYNGEKIDPYTYSRVQKNAGQKSYELIDYLRTSDRSGMSDVMQAEIIPELYSYAKDVALDKAGIKYLSGTNEKLAQIEDEQGTDALIAYLSISKMEGSGSSGGLVKDDWINYLDSSDLTPLQKAYIFRLKYPKSKDNPFE